MFDDRRELVWSEAVWMTSGLSPCRSAQSVLFSRHSLTSIGGVRSTEMIKLLILVSFNFNIQICLKVSFQCFLGLMAMSVSQAQTPAQEGGQGADCGVECLREVIPGQIQYNEGQIISVFKLQENPRKTIQFTANRFFVNWTPRTPAVLAGGNEG